MAELEKLDPNKIMEAMAEDQKEHEQALLQRAQAEHQAALKPKNVPFPSQQVIANHRNDPNIKIDPHSIVDVYGRPLKYGNEDPNVIGPDDTPPKLLPGMQLRERVKYPKSYPNELFECEEQWVLPFAAYVAEHIVNVNLLDELTYSKVQKELKRNNIFVILDISGPKIHDGVVTWEGLKVWCKTWPVVVVTFKLDIRTKVASIESIKIWQNKPGRHVLLKDPNMQVTREYACQIISNYFLAEGILV